MPAPVAGPLAAAIHDIKTRRTAVDATNRVNRAMERGNSLFWLSAINLPTDTRSASFPGGVDVFESQGNVAFGRCGRRRRDAVVCGQPDTLPALVFRTPPIMPPPPRLRAFGAFGRQSAAVRARQGGARFAPVDYATATSSASSISRWAPTIRASTSCICRAARSKAIRVAHGRGSDPDHCGFLEHFSNQFGSEATSNGAYMTAEHLSRQVRAFDEGPRPRLVEQQCREPRPSSFTTPGMPSPT